MADAGPPPPYQFGLSDEELRRYSRQILLREVGGRGQRSILDGEVMLLGPPGSGAAAAQYLLRAGVGRLVLVPTLPLAEVELRALLDSEDPELAERATLASLASLPAWLNELRQAAPGYLLGGWTDRSPEVLYWAGGDPESSAVGLGEASLRERLARASSLVTPVGAQALLVGAALALALIQGRLGLQPSDAVLLPGCGATSRAA